MTGHINEFSTELAPPVFYLGQNYPNPFKGKTIIKYCVSSTARVILTVYNSEGELIKKLVDEEKEPGTYEIEFSACHSCENKNPKSEVYIYCLEAGNYKSEKKMQLI